MTSESAVELQCGRPYSDFHKSVYNHINDRFCNAIVIPAEKFVEIDCEPFSYVQVRPQEGNLDTDTDSLAKLYAVPFDEDTGPSDKAAISTNLMRKIHPELGVGDTIEVKPIDADLSRQLTVSLPYSDTEGIECYVSEGEIDDVDVAATEKIEVINPNTGGRVITQTNPLRKKDEPNSDIRLRLAIIKNLGLEVGDEVRARRYVETTASTHSWRQKLTHLLNTYILESLVGSRTVFLRVRRGLPRDERRNIVRIPESTRRYLGVSSGDMVSIRWKQNQTTSQCLPPISKDAASQEDTTTELDAQPYDIAMPSTIRDTIEISPRDSVRVKRDTWDIFQKQIGISILGILGVLFGTFQIFNVTGWFSVIVRQIGRILATVSIFALAMGVSLIVIILIFLPVRGEV